MDADVAADWKASEIASLCNNYLAEHHDSIVTFGASNLKFRAEPSAGVYLRRNPADARGRSVNDATEKLVRLLLMDGITKLIEAAHKDVEEERLARRAAKRRATAPQERK